MSQKKPQVKIGQIRLTEHEKEVIAVNMDSEFFKIIVKKIIPRRLVQVSLTNLATSQNAEELWFFKGRYAEADWLTQFLQEQAKKIDIDDGDPEA